MGLFGGSRSGFLSLQAGLAQTLDEMGEVGRVHVGGRQLPVNLLVERALALQFRADRACLVDPSELAQGRQIGAQDKINPAPAQAALGIMGRFLVVLLVVLRERDDPHEHADLRIVRIQPRAPQQRIDRLGEMTDIDADPAETEIARGEIRIEVDGPLRGGKCLGLSARRNTQQALRVMAVRVALVERDGAVRGLACFRKVPLGLLAEAVPDAGVQGPCEKGVRLRQLWVERDGATKPVEACRLSSVVS